MPTIIEAIDAAARGAAARAKIGGFPYVAESLRAAGVTKYLFDVPSTTVVYVTDEGAVLRPGQVIRTEQTVVHSFDSDGLVAAIRIDQRGAEHLPGIRADLPCRRRQVRGRHCRTHVHLHRRQRLELRGAVSRG